MNLNDVTLNKECVIIGVDLDDFDAGIRLMELGLTRGTHIKVLKKSVFKKTLLISFYSICFTLQDQLAKGVVVDYV